MLTLFLWFNFRSQEVLSPFTLAIGGILKGGSTLFVIGFLILILAAGLKAENIASWEQLFERLATILPKEILRFAFLIRWLLVIVIFVATVLPIDEFVRQITWNWW